MSPLTVLRTLWNHKWVAFTIAFLTLGSCIYVYMFAPRNYEAAVTYALTAPNLPSAEEKQQDSSLANLNPDNPYLRSSDSSLLTQVTIAKLTDPAYVESLHNSGMATDFTIVPVASLGMGLVSLTAVSDSKQEAVTTATFLGKEFTSTLRAVQKVNGADDRYLYEPILVRGPGPAVEQYSNRLRSLIMVVIAGGLALFAAVSVAQSVSLRKKRKPADEPGDRLGDSVYGASQQYDDQASRRMKKHMSATDGPVPDLRSDDDALNREWRSGQIYERR